LGLFFYVYSNNLGGFVKNFFFFILISAAVFGNKAFSQTFGIGGGLSTVTGPDSYTNDLTSGGIGFSSGYHLGVKLKFGLPVAPFKPFGFVNYTHFSTDQSSPLGNVAISQSIWSIGAGGQFNLIPGPINPYIAANVAYNNFGDLDIEGIDIDDFEGGGAKSRFGGGIGIGAELSVLIIGLDASITYNFLNWVGKESDEETVSVISYNLTVLF
jgi:hypothetical protein